MSTIAKNTQQIPVELDSGEGDVTLVVSDAKLFEPSSCDVEVSC